MAEAVKRIRLDITSANPNLTGLTQTINKLELLNSYLRKVNGQIGMLGRTLGVPLADVGKSVETMTAKASKGMDAIGASARSSTAEIQKMGKMISTAETIVKDADKKAISRSERQKFQEGNVTTTVGRTSTPAPGGGWLPTGETQTTSQKFQKESQRYQAALRDLRARQSEQTAIESEMQARNRALVQSGQLTEQQRYQDALKQLHNRQGLQREEQVLATQHRSDFENELADRRANDASLRRAVRSPEEQAARSNKADELKRQRAQERQDRERERRDEGRSEREAVRQRDERFNRDLNRIRSHRDAVSGVNRRAAADEARNAPHRGIFGSEGRLINRGLRGFTPTGFATNVLTVGGWMTAVNAFYGIVNLAQHSLQRIEGIQLQTARLEQVFRGVGGSARELTDDVLKLAAAEGRTADEAVASAIAWSRLGLTRRQVNDATRVSLMAANVAEMSAGETTQHLAAVMAGFGLEVSQLQAVLGMLNQTSNTYRVTNADLLTGLSRVSSIAQQAGLSLAELQGILGATVQKTGQTGANIANALKTTLVRMNRPDVQEFFSSRYKVKTTGSAEDLQKIYELYVKGNDVQRRDILLKVGAATQANRLRAIFESYPEALNAAVQSLLNLNSAEAENVKITNTMAAARQRMVTSWDRFINSPVAAGLMANVMNNFSGMIAGATGGPSSMRFQPRYQDPGQANLLGTLFGFLRTTVPEVGTLNKIGPIRRWIDRQQGYFTTPQTGDQIFDAASRRINEQQSKGEANKIIARMLESEGKLFAGRTPEQQGNLRKILSNYMRPEDVGNQAEMNRLAQEYRATAEQNLQLANAYLQADIQRLKNESDLETNAEKRKSIDADLAERQNQLTKAQSGYIDKLNDELSTRQEIARAMEIQHQLAQDIAQTFQGLGLNDLQRELVTTMAQIDAMNSQRSTEKNSDVREQLDHMVMALHARQTYLQSPAARTFNRFGIDRDVMSAVTGAQFGEGVGVTQGEKLLDKRKQIERELNRLNVTEASSQNDKIRGMILLKELANTELALRVRATENMREQKQLAIDTAREFQKSLVGAGPGELLRKLAAFQLNRRGMNAGSFFALSPEAQRDVYDLRGGDRASDLNREAGALRGSTLGTEGLQGKFESLNVLAGSMAMTLQNSFDVSKLAADAVASSLGAAAQSARVIESAMANAARSAASTGVPSAPNAAPVPQAVPFTVYGRNGQTVQGMDFSK